MRGPLCVVVAGALALGLVRSAAADPLTRPSCWTWSDGAGGKRTLCFAGSSRVKMTNRSQTVDEKGWSTCNWSGQYGRGAPR